MATTNEIIKVEKTALVCENSKTSSNEIIKVENLSKNFGKLEVLKDISFTVHEGDVLGIIGPSGSGKSTLLRCICQLENVSGGSISIAGESLVQDGVYAD